MAYITRDIDAALKQLMTNSNHDDSRISISANASTLKTVVELKNNYQVDFSIDSSLRIVLGFNEPFTPVNYQESENVVNIMNVNSILDNIDVITRSYVNRKMQPTIYCFFLILSPGYKIVEEPAHLKYLPVTLDTITNL